MTGLINYASLELLLPLLKRDWTSNPNRLPAVYTCPFLTFILCRTKEEAALIWIHSRMTHKQEDGREGGTVGRDPERAREVSRGRAEE